MNEPKKIKYICKLCKHTEDKFYPVNNSVKVEHTLICPECRRLAFEAQNPSYVERMKEKK